MTDISIGTWAFGAYADDPLDFEVVLDRLAELEFDGIELGAFPPHPDPETCASPEQREARASIHRPRHQLDPVDLPFT